MGSWKVKEWEGILWLCAYSSPFPLNFPFSLVSPRENLFTVNTTLMSRKDPKCNVGSVMRESGENNRGMGVCSHFGGVRKQAEHLGTTLIAHKHKSTRCRSDRPVIVSSQTDRWSVDHQHTGCKEEGGRGLCVNLCVRANENRTLASAAL